MVRRRPNKLIVYDGYPPQLFDLENDPGERFDLSTSATHAGILAELSALVHEGWHPEEIEVTMARRRANKDLQAAWARSVRPPDTIRFRTAPEMNWLAPDGD